MGGARAASLAHRDLRHPLPLQLVLDPADLEVLDGVELMNNKKECPECEGEGCIAYHTYEGDKEWDACYFCSGTGYVPMEDMR